MRDNVVLLIDNVPVRDFLSYRIDSDLFMAADSWEFELSDFSVKINPASKVELKINGIRELIGIVDKRNRKVSKNGKSISVAGRDLMGILCDHCVTEFGEETDLSGKTLRQLAKALIKDIPYIYKLSIVGFESGCERLGEAWETFKADPGQTVFEVLKKAANGRGLHFWCNEEGAFVFGKPLAKGRPEFYLTARPEANYTEGSWTHDISEAYSKVIVYCQSQETNLDFSSTNVAASASLSVPAQFPFYKPKVVTRNGDSAAASREAKRLLNTTRSRLNTLEYTVPGHSQNGRNWRTNKIVRIDDAVLGVRGDYLIYGRTYEMSRDGGPTTRLRIGDLGVEFE